MKKTEEDVVSGYSSGGLFERILNALREHGVERDQIDQGHLAPIDEFHIGGTEATEVFLRSVDLEPGTLVLDLGSGLGGPARYMARELGATVTGVDLTPEFVDTARQLSSILGVDVAFEVGSVLDLPFADESFDVATMFHVGMNLPDKPQLFREAARVLSAEGQFAVYDVMLFGEHPSFPLPWAMTSDASFLASTDEYVSAAEAAGFELTHRLDRGDVARAFFAKMRALLARSGPPPLGPPVVLGESAPTRLGNMADAVDAGHVAPVELVFKKSSGADAPTP